ncbi:MAG: molybdopterin-guanine dinucleotide biosynthesis protein B [Candidatus Brocadiales bacterium]
MNSHRNIPVVSIIGDKKSGKTTLIEELVSTFKKEGHRVGVLKYALREFQIDHEGKDTYRFYHSGADAVGITSHNKMAFIKRIKSPPPVDKFLESLFSDADLVLLEGYKGYEYPRICLIMPGKGLVEAKPPSSNKDCPVLRINVSGEENPISPKVLQEALSFVRQIIERPCW